MDATLSVDAQRAAQVAGRARPLTTDARFALGGESELPFQLPSQLLPAEFEKLATVAHRSRIADIKLLTGDYIYFSVKKRWRRASNRRLTAPEMQTLLPAIAGENAVAQLCSGRERNGRYEVRPPDQRGVTLGFRMNAIQCRAGNEPSAIEITLRIIDETPPTLAVLKVDEDLAEALRVYGGGLVMVAGATGMGKTSLLAAVLRDRAMNDPDSKILTYENPIEFVLGADVCAGPMPAQSQVGRDIESFVAGAINVMRRASQVVMFGECRHSEEARGVIDCALSGHVTYTTLHAETVAEVFPRIINMFPATEQAAIANKLLDSTRVLVAQKLLPTVNNDVVALREWIVFDKSFRQRLADMSWERWSSEIRNECRVRGRTFEQAANQYRAVGQLDDKTYRAAVGFVGNLD